MESPIVVLEDHCRREIQTVDEGSVQLGVGIEERRSEDVAAD
jgi:hypothetical protein